MMLKRVLVGVLFITMVTVWSPASRLVETVSANDRLTVVTGANGGAEELREEFQQTYPLNPTGRISLENLNGSVHIAVWDRSEVQVKAVKRANRRERLEEAKIDVSATPDLIRIKTRYPGFNQNFNPDEKGRNNNPAIVEYSLIVPRQARLESIDLINGSLEVEGVEGDVKASSINGRLAARGLMGEAKLSTVNGNLEATFAKLNDAKPISLGSVNGCVTLMIPSSSNAVVRASTVFGDIQNDFGLAVQHGEYVGHEVYGQIGTNGTRIKLGNVNGPIVIKHLADGGKISPATSLLAQKEKDKEKNKERLSEDALKLKAEARQRAEEIRRESLANINTEQIAEQARIAAQRDAERAIREAEREMQRVQLQIQREARQQEREQMRREARADSEGAGAGSGSGRGAGGLKFVAQESKSFVVSGVPRVNVMTFDGMITVHGWDKSEVAFTATKRAGDEQGLKDVTIKAEQQGAGIAIIASSSSNSGSASFEVYVPRKVNLHVSSNDGRLSLDGVNGDLTLRTSDGPIHVSDSGGQLRVNSNDGSIRIMNFDGDADARTGDGALSLVGRFTGLTARTGDGSISLAVPADSNFTVETNAEQVTGNGLAIAEDIAPSQRVKRWKIGRGGTVFVINTGEGSLTIRAR